MKNWKILVLGLFVGLLSSGLVLLISKGTFNHTFALQPIPTPRPLVVHIAGGVVSPGVYEVPQNSRVIDAVELAGGFSDSAARDEINLSEPLTDGEKIIIPVVSGSLISVPDSIESKASSGPIPLININTADTNQLSTLPGIGPVIASDIIEYRNSHGGFSSIDELLKVKGIGETTFENIKDLVILR